MTAFRCPSCGHATELAVSAVVPDEQRFALVLQPEPGRLLTAGTVGGAMADMQKLMAALGRNMGVPNQTFVEGLEFRDGAVTVKMTVVAVGRPKTNAPGQP